MKTLQDLVGKLNEVDDDYEYSIYKIFGKHFICVDEDDDYGKKLSMIMFDTDGNEPTWRVDKHFFLMPPEPQTIAVNYLANSNPSDWFAEKKYNIVIGIDTNTDFKTAYRKTSSSDAFEVNGYTELSELRKGPYIFTEKEIEDLKVTLPPDLSKIVDLGKVEVKDD